MSRKKVKSHTKKSDYKILLEGAVIAALILLGYYLYSADREQVGQATGGLGCDASAQCDGSDLKGASCASLGFAGGELRCDSCRFDTLLCTTCGNGIVDKGEQCDGDINGQSCSGLNAGSGTLGCTKYCLYDMRGCSR